MKLQQLWTAVLLTSTSVLVATPAFAQVFQITGVRVQATPSGFEVILESNEKTIPEVFTSSSDKTLLTDIENTQLRLPDGKAFRQDNPVEGIASVTVTQLSPNTVRVAVTGTTQLPTTQINRTQNALVLNLSVPASTAQTSPDTPPAPVPQTQPENTEQAPEQAPEQTPQQAPSPAPESNDEPIELLVTGEEDDGYFVPDATTGTRTDTPILKTPASIQVIPQQVLKDQQTNDIVEALDNISGVSADSGEGRDTSISIRGFNQAPILIDGFRLFGTSLPIETANLERIEVLRGPASILYGDVQPGGIVNLVTKKPLAQPFYELQVQAGSYGLIRPQIDLSGPLNDDGSVLYRLNAVYSREDGFRDFDTEYKRFFVSPVVTWKIGDRTDLTLAFEYLDDERPFDTGLVAFGDGIADIPRDRILGEPDDVSRRNIFQLGYNLEHRFSRNWTLRNAFRYTEQDFNTQVAIPIIYNEETGNLTRFYADQTLDSDSYSLQTNIVGKFATGPINHTLLAGVDLDRTFGNDATLIDLRNPLSLNIFNPQYRTVPRTDKDDLSFFFGSDTRTRRLGVYIQDQIAFGDSLNLVAGLRYDTVDFEDRLNETSNYSDALSPRIALIYQPTKTVSVYASYSKSFVPSFALDVNRDPLEPERSEGYEVGIKTELLDSKLFASLAYFDITKQNVATADPVVLGASVATGEQNSQGVEFDLRGEILPGWNLLASYSYIDAKVTEDEDIPVGNELPGVPRNSASLWTTYQLQSGNLKGLGLGVGVNFVGDRQGDRENTFELGNYLLTNAAIFYRRDNWQVGLNFKNIFDVDYIRGEPSSRFRGIEVGEPFTIIGSLSVQF